MMTILIFLILLLALILVHEAGHALAARWSGCRVEEFGFGLPPRLLSKRIGETVFSLNALPIGGFVKITGEDGEAAGDPRSFTRQPRWQRALMLAAGVLGNLLLAWVVFTVVAGAGVDVPIEVANGRATDRRVEILEVRDVPALRDSGIQAGDLLVSALGETVSSAEQAAQRVRGAAGETVTLGVRRGDEVREVTLTFTPSKQAGEPVGLGLLDVGTIRVPWILAPQEGLRRTGQTMALTASGLGRIVREAVLERKAPADVAGPIGIASITGVVAKRGFLPLLELTGVLSVNLALVNILPIPALDGGRLLFLLLDALGLRFLRGKPERLAHTIGFALLLLLLALITLNDIGRLTQ